MTSIKEKDVKQLNKFLKNELSAVETYDQCIEKISDPQIAQGLTTLKSSHAERARLLTQRIHELGGDPADSSGAWGGLTKLLEGGAKIFGESSALAMLEEGEDKGRDDYQEQLGELSPESQAFIRKSILTEQLHTHDQLNALKKLQKTSKKRDTETV